MKKNSWFIVLGSLAAIFLFAFLLSQYLGPVIDIYRNKAVYSETSCMTSEITDEMSIYDIAKKYRDSNATVQFKGQYKDNYSGTTYSILGSGVVVASTGYQTTSLNENITAEHGSFIATNYHVVDFLDNSNYRDKTLKVRAEDEVEYSCEVLWKNKNLDVALVYADVSYNYIKMSDRWVDCDAADKLDYEPVFVVGSPLEEQNINRLTIGNIASNNEVLMFTEQTVYYTINNMTGGISFSYSQTSLNQRSLEVLDNVYEDIIDISVGISGGNSGGGVFDSKGNLIGLATLGTSADETGGNQINGAVAIYPIMKVLDRVVANKETSANYKIYTIEDLGLYGIDAYEATYSSSYKSSGFSYYFINGRFYSASSYGSYFNFEEDGFEILNNSNAYSALSNINSGAVIKSITINDITHDIKDRNDFLNWVISLSEGQTITLTYETKLIIGTSSHTVNVTL